MLISSRTERETKTIKLSTWNVHTPYYREEEKSYLLLLTPETKTSLHSPFNGEFNQKNYSKAHI